MGQNFGHVTMSPIKGELRFVTHTACRAWGRPSARHSEARSKVTWQPLHEASLKCRLVLQSSIARTSDTS